MTLRERIGSYVLRTHITDSYYVPNNDGTKMGTAYFEIKPIWRKIAALIAGTDDYAELIRKSINEYGKLERFIRLYILKEKLDDQ